jgi:glycosyltransferase involved in cell wall biosynthesis
LRILWFNWRDIKNPDAGGAEVLIHEIARRLAERGYVNTLFTSRFPNCANNERVDNIDIVREGGKYTVYEKARQFYDAHCEKCDIVIDSINTKPFLTPKFVKSKPIIALFYQLAREFWFFETHFPINLIGYHILEKRWLNYYREIPTVTISNSSMQDLLAIGFKKIFMITLGLQFTPLTQVSEKERSPTLIFVGRLKKAKCPDHALQAFCIIKKTIPEAKMWIIGDGYMKKELEQLNVKDAVFYGRVTNELKYNLLSKAHLTLVPGIREGWGLVVTESNAMGTPVVAYKVPGLRDSVVDGETGLLVAENSPRSLANSALKLLENKDLLNRYSINALASSKNYNWNDTANEFERIVKTIA